MLDRLFVFTPKYVRTLVQLCRGGYFDILTSCEILMNSSTGHGHVRNTYFVNPASYLGNCISYFTRTPVTLLFFLFVGKWSLKFLLKRFLLESLNVLILAFVSYAIQ